LKARVKAFSIDRSSSEFLLRYLRDIRDEKPDEDAQREIVAIWKATNSFEEWKKHLNYLIAELDTEIKT
jgi:hypothetical protein